MSYHRFKNEDGDEYGSFEVFESEVMEIECKCGTYEVPADREGDEICDTTCPSCLAENVPSLNTGKRKWWWWACFPGCMPDGEVNGPFDSEKEAIDDAREE